MVLIGSVLTYTVLKYLAIGLIATGASGIAIKGAVDLANDIAQWKESKETKKEWEAQQNELRENKKTEAWNEAKDTPKELGLVYKEGVGWIPKGESREEAIANNPLQNYTADISADKKLAEALGLNEKNGLGWVNPENISNKREEAIANNPLQGYEKDITGSKTLAEVLNLAYIKGKGWQTKPQSKEEAIANNPLQSYTADYSADQKLMEALGISKADFAPFQPQVIPQREEAIANNPLQSYTADYSADQKLMEALGITKGDFAPQAPQQPTEKDPIPNIGDTTVNDTTNENIESEVNGIGLDYWIKWMEEKQKELWAREDAIRKETQEREDTAIQRQVEDMRKAGVNPNLMGIAGSGAQSGGGITQASQVDMSALNTQMNIDLKEMQQMIDQAFQGNENDKDRFTDIFGSVIQSIIMYMILGK